MNELVKVKTKPHVIDGELLRPDPAYDGRAIPGTYGAITRYPLRHVLYYPEVEVKEGTVVDWIPPTRDWNPSPIMRLLGYTRNPDTCRHGRKGYTPREGWWCMECGDSL